MKPFTGFPKARDVTLLPNVFFDQLLPQIDDFAELKVLLHIMALLQRQKGWPRCVSRPQLERDELLSASLSAMGDMRSLGDVLDHALERASQRGSLLRLTVRDGAAAEDWYMLNTERGRALVRDLEGHATETEELRRRLGAATQATIEADKPNIFTLYEQNIGLLTRLMAEELMEAEATYPPLWIEEAFRKAVTGNKRNWRYIKAILSRWAAEGREDGTIRRHPGEIHDPDRYFKGEFGHLFRREREQV
ncbi:MAG: DnaD domain protein [Chloroflexi bacterium]|nr:DnaD domain protein [Chloroflexota bacterium]